MSNLQSLMHGALETAEAAYEAAKRYALRLDDRAEEVVQAQIRAV